MKPDLFVHPSFYCDVLKFKNISAYFNIINVGKLEFETAKIQIVTGNTEEDSKQTKFGKPQIKNFYDVDCKKTQLVPFFNIYKKEGISTFPHYTTFNITTNQIPQKCNFLAPRYLLWTVDDPLTVSTTIVNRTKSENLGSAIENALSWAEHFQNLKECSVIVFDLDETLIDSKCNIYKGAVDLLKHARERYDIMVLWSHGSAVHVEDNLKKLDIGFDIVLTNQLHKSAKNLLHLYNYKKFRNQIFYKAVLVDDSLYNFCQEYTKVIVPHKLIDLSKIKQLI